MNDKTILISGGTGMVGTALTNHLIAKGYRVIILTRNPRGVVMKADWSGKVSYAAWDVKEQTIDAIALAKADALIHLAGAGVVDKPWTDSYKKEILDSRVQSSKLLVNAIQKHGAKMQTVLCASAIGWYGADSTGKNIPFTEEAPAAKDFLGETCKAWEESMHPVIQLGKRLVHCRIGIVLSNTGGALPEFKKSLRFRIAGILGSGKQMISWIHIEDLCRLFCYALETPALQGAYNGVAPLPVDNYKLNIALANSMYGNSFISLPVPEFVLKIMMGERSIEVLKSTTVSAQKILHAGFEFNYPNIETAMAELSKS
jgi:uncharacterized protein (TIGR01777 family)